MFRTSQVAYLRSSLESWQPACVACTLSALCLQNEARRERHVHGLQLCLPVCLCLWLVEVLACLSQFFCRRNRVVFGGSGVNSSISFPVEHVPEAALRDYAATIKAAHEAGGAAKAAPEVTVRTVTDF